MNYSDIVSHHNRGTSTKAKFTEISELNALMLILKKKFQKRSFDQ